MKDAYLETIRAAGFEGVEIVDEAALALDCFANDPIVQTARNNLSLTPEELDNVASAVVSIKVVGEKP